MRILVISLIVIILIFLGCAALFTFRDRGQNKVRAVTAMTCTVALSLLLFFVLMLSADAGLLSAHPLNRRH